MNEEDVTRATIRCFLSDVWAKVKDGDVAGFAPGLFVRCVSPEEFADNGARQEIRVGGFWMARVRNCAAHHHCRWRRINIVSKDATSTTVSFSIEEISKEEEGTGIPLPAEGDNDDGSTNLNPSDESFLGVPRHSCELIRLRGDGSDNSSVTHIEWRSTLVDGTAQLRRQCRALREAAISRLKATLGGGEIRAVRMFSGGGVDGDRRFGRNNNAVVRDGTAPSSLVDVLDPSTNTWVRVAWDCVTVGDVVSVNCRESFPADLLVLGASSDQEICITTSCFDGDPALRLRHCLSIDIFGGLDDGDGGGQKSNDEGEGEAERGAGVGSADEMLTCPACTFLNSALLRKCDMCGIDFEQAPRHHRTSELLMDVLGSGRDSLTTVHGLARAGVFAIAEPSASIQHFSAHFLRGGKVIEAAIEDGQEIISRACADAEKSADEDVKSKKRLVADASFAYQQFLPHRSQLIMTSRIVALVVYAGVETKFALNNGIDGYRKNAAAKERVEAFRLREAEALRLREAEVLCNLYDPIQYEEETGVQWERKFTDVVDDGNCLFHAFWLGFKTLTELYPRLKITPDELLPATPEIFREEALRLMASDVEYLRTIQSMLKLWLEVDTTLLISMEDFFTIRPSFQQVLLVLNQGINSGERKIESINFDQLCDQYLEATAATEVINGRTVYSPLGEVEISALCRLYKCQIQTVKSESLCAIVRARAEIDGNGDDDVEKAMLKIDPRTIRPEHCLDRGAQFGRSRVVRLLNVRSNHYQVHLPTK